jgi:hypothetical protein
MKNKPRRLFGLLLLLGVWFMGGGCDGPASGPEGPTSKGLVSGMVRMKGRPVASGEVTFEPTGGSAAGTEPRKAPITNGSYETGLITGQYRVTVQKSQAGKALTPIGEPKQLEVGGGMMTFDIDL